MERKGCCNRQRKNGKAERKIRRTIMGIGEGVKMGRMSKRHVKVHSFDAFVSRELLIQFFFFFPFLSSTRRFVVEHDALLDGFDSKNRW